MLNGRVSHWWEEVGLPAPREQLRGHSTADVAIVGAGFTGLWTAYYLAKANPKLDITILEARHVGYGASGRNGDGLPIPSPLAATATWLPMAGKRSTTSSWP